MSEKKPTIRFKGFDNYWEQRKLGDFVIIKSGWSPSNFEETNGNENLFVKVDDLNYSIRVQKNSNMKVIKHPKYHKMKKGSTIFPKRGAAIMTNKIRILGKDGYMDTNMMALEPNGIDGEFLYTFIDRTGLYKIADTSTIPQINNKHIEPYEITLPELAEQKKIGYFFMQLDETITLHQQQLENLKKAKKGYLQKMFPKNSEKVPEIRFEGFADDWEQRKLGEVFLERSERSGDGELISVTINSGIVKASELDRKDNSSDDKSNYKRVEIGDIAYNSMRMWQGASGYSPYDGILSPAYTVIIPEEGIDSKFFAYDFKRYDMIQTFKRNSQGLTSDTWNLKFPTLKSVKVMVPCIEEQKQTSAFFEELDKTIALHQRKLDYLKEMKKGLLQKMFV